MYGRLDRNLVTLIAALVAAVASLASVQTQRRAARSDAFRAEQIKVVEETLRRCYELLSTGWIIFNEKSALIEAAATSSAKAALASETEVSSVLHRAGTDMTAFHLKCREVELLHWRIADASIRQSVRTFSGGIENYRLFENQEQGLAMINALQAELSDLLRLGGEYCVDLFPR